jgi:hypothetical protein
MAVHHRRQAVRAATGMRSSAEKKGKRDRAKNQDAFFFVIL